MNHLMTRKRWISIILFSLSKVKQTIMLRGRCNLYFENLYSSSKVYFQCESFQNSGFTYFWATYIYILLMKIWQFQVPKRQSLSRDNIKVQFKNFRFRTEFCRKNTFPFSVDELEKFLNEISACTWL